MANGEIQPATETVTIRSCFSCPAARNRGRSSSLFRLYLMWITRQARARVLGLLLAGRGQFETLSTSYRVRERILTTTSRSVRVRIGLPCTLIPRPDFALLRAAAFDCCIRQPSGFEPRAKANLHHSGLITSNKVSFLLLCIGILFIFLFF